MILVTGATGGLGHETIDCLLTTTPATEIAALVRDASKATDLVANFFAQWGAAAQHGMLAGTHDTVERLLGRKPTSLREYLKATYFPGA